MFKELPPELKFPRDFLWGVSTAAYQIEGGNRGSDLWDWEARKGWERSGEACGSWRRWGEDLKCLRELGVGVYRFSVEWGRIQPEPGRTDSAALKEYARRVRDLASAGIEPIVCLHHFTHPNWFWRLHPTGWADPRSVESFLGFAKIVADALGDRVRTWLTFNEPMVVLGHSHLSGHFPPGRRSLWDSNPPSLRAAVANVARAHRLAAARLGGRVGIAQNIAKIEPLRDRPEDVRAALLWDQFFHWNLLDGLATGRMDLDLDGEAETVLDGPPRLDFIGVNYYTRIFVRHIPIKPPLQALPLYSDFVYRKPLLGLLFLWAGGWKMDHPTDDLGHETFPEGIESVVRTTHRRYRLPILITENGIADAKDRLREVHLLSHLMRLRRAMDEAKVLGYLYWSLMDNYEWGSFGPRLGLYRVDFDDGLKRTLRPAGRLFKEIAALSQG